MQELGTRKARIEDVLNPLSTIGERLAYVQDSSAMLDEEGGDVFAPELAAEVQALSAELEALELKSLMTGTHDPGNAILMINPGAGGIESQDWARMLMRMYLMWAENQGYKTRVLDLQEADEAGIKSATISIEGPFAYGYLKVEAGVHRLVRISPYDANKRRHTSFSAVLVGPELQDDVEVTINDDDLRVDTFRASGAGGQHVNKTASAIRLTHMPTGLVVSCQSDRSQYRNRETAMKILRSRLYDIQQKEQEEEMQDMLGEKKNISWGSQIRSYVLQPYQMVKDHRTDVETGNVGAVLDGDINKFIKSALRLK